MTTAKVQSTHCERIAFVYVRQSTWLQVKDLGQGRDCVDARGVATGAQQQRLVSAH